MKFSDPQELAVQVAADLGRTIQALEETERSRFADLGQPANAVAAEIQTLAIDAVKKGVPPQTLLSLFRRVVTDLVARSGEHQLHSQDRMNQMEALYAPSKGYYALDIELANGGLNEEIPPKP